MIQANVAAAETLEAKKSPLIYRIHDSPSRRSSTRSRDFLSSLDMSCRKPAPSGRPLQPHPRRDARHPDAPLVNEVILRSPGQAEYAPGNIGHFGLNLRRYAHFTSPIRRYADLIVHRALMRALELGDDGLTDRDERAEGRASDLGLRAARHGRRARHGRPADRRLSRRARRRGVPGAHLGPRAPGLFVELIETGADGFVPASRSGTNISFTTRSRQRWSARIPALAFRLGDPVEVRLVEAIPTAGALRFEMLSEGRSTGRDQRAPVVQVTTEARTATRASRAGKAVAGLVNAARAP